MCCSVSITLNRVFKMINIVSKLIELSHQDKLSQDGDFQVYCDALLHFWQGKHKVALDFVSTKIIEQDSILNLFQLYRLWIEILCVDKERDSLRLLLDHLLERSTDEPANKTWLALRGLIHLELDDAEACSLYASSIYGATSNPYCMEFEYRHKLRTSDSSVDEGWPFCDSEVGLKDYFHWVLVAQSALLNESDRALFQVLDFISGVHKKSPFEDYFMVYLALDNAEYPLAVKHSRLLKSNFPRVFEYHVLYGYSLLKSGDVKGSIPALKQANSMPGYENDPDVLSMLSRAYYLRSEDDVYSSHWENSLLYLERASAIYRELGISVPNLGLQSADQEDMMVSKGQKELALPDHPVRIWFVNMNGLLSHKLNDCDEDQISELVHELGSEVNENDLVFFGSEGYQDETGMRLSLLYRVKGKEIFHPLKKCTRGLQLLKRFEEPLKVGFDLDSMQRTVGRTEKQHVEGLFLVDDPEFELIRKAIGELTEVFDFSEHFRAIS